MCKSDRYKRKAIHLVFESGDRKKGIQILLDIKEIRR